MEMTKTELSALIAEQVKAGLRDHRPESVAAKLFAPARIKRAGTVKSILGATIHSLYRAKNNPVIAAEYAKARYGEGSEVHQFFEKTALVTTSGSDGEDFVQTTVAAEVIEALRPASVVRASGAQVMQVPGGSLQIPRTNGVTGGWVGENANRNAEQPTTDNVTLTPKKAHVKVPLSKELIADSSPDAEQAIADDVVAAMASLTDSAYIRGSGGPTVPTGIRNAVSSGQIKVSTGNTSAQVETDLTDLLEKVMGANNLITPQSGVWYMSSRSFNFLRKLRDPNGNLIYPELNGAQPMLYNYRAFVTNNIPNNLAFSATSPSGDESEIYFGRAPSLMIGDKEQLMLEVLENVAYTNSGGTLVSGVDLDTVIVKAMLRTDIVLRHPTAFGILIGVQYGVVSNV